MRGMQALCNIRASREAIAFNSCLIDGGFRPLIAADQASTAPQADPGAGMPGTESQPAAACSVYLIRAHP